MSIETTTILDLANLKSELELLRINNKKLESELFIAQKELAFQKVEKGKRAAELGIANIELAFQDEEKEKRAEELDIANIELAFQDKEKGKRAAELGIANIELAFQDEEKGKRAEELIIANKELAFQNDEKEKRAEELSIANKELIFQNNEKEKRAEELSIANEELIFQNNEKEKRAAELYIANQELIYQTDEKKKRADELAIADIELAFQNSEKEKRDLLNCQLETANCQIKLSSDYARSLIEASLDPLVTIDADGKIMDVNEASVKVTGVSRENLINTDFSDYFTEPDKAQVGYRQVFEKGFVEDYPLTIKHNNGKLTDVLYNASVYKNVDGKVLGVFAAARDVTVQKRIETESIILLKELTEAKVFAELSTLIAEEAKLKAENATRIAEDAVKAKQQFLSNMSHEIRTPMNAIIGFTKVVLKTDLTLKQKEYLTAIKVSGDALIVLINDILDLAKVDSGKMTFEKKPFKMSVSIAAMLHLFELKIQEKNLKLIKEYDNNIPEILIGDPVRLHQIILNLISNAVKFTSKGFISVSVKLISQNAESVKIEFAVKDTGIGIGVKKIGQIFDDFQQATSGTSRLYGGTGLGLSIVKQLVESQGGCIEVCSEIDQGSKFSFMLDFLKTTEEAEIESDIIELDDEIKNIKVLVVEDIAINQLLMKTLLDDFGFERDIASNGKVAIEKLKLKTYDIILMDLQMPEMNGFEATEYIRNVLHSKVPIIALTADVTTVDLAKCRAVGMNDYIAKPVDDRLLYHKIIGQVKKKALLKSMQDEDKLKYTNLSYLNSRTKSNPLLMMEMINLYLEQTPMLIQSMRLSLDSQDWPTLQAAAHKMISSFSIMGIDKEYESMAKNVQEFTRSLIQMHEIPHLVSQIEMVCIQACKELEEELIKIKSQTNDK